MELLSTLLVATALLVLFLLWRRSPDRRFVEMADKIPGPSKLPLVGNALELGGNDFLNAFERISKQYGTPFRIWIGNELTVCLAEPKDIEILLGSSRLIDKADNYNLLHSWLGMGLLTSTGSKWRRNRKIITPTFHFTILEEFVDVFYANGIVLNECLQEKVGSPGFDIHHYITLSALDNICETAMGLKINAMKDAESNYVQALKGQADSVVDKWVKPWLQNKMIAYLTGYAAQERRYLATLHGTTQSLIKSRLSEILKERAAEGGSDLQDSDKGIKRRLAFLDLLIGLMLDGSGLTEVDIREEVDTFMFEGHDTVAAALTFTLWLLAWHQDIQDAVVEELLEIWLDTATPLTQKSLQQCKLLERVIKESLRLYPSVPVFGRKLSEDTTLSGGLVIPKDAAAGVLIMTVHKNPDIYPDPERFDPDRFLPENVLGRHPYAYIPFSAGPRNCIGQKFAMLEMKCTLAQVLREYKFLPAAHTQSLKLINELTLTAKNGVPVTIQRRH